MNINQVKAFTWLASTVMTAGLGYYVFDFLSHRDELTQPRISEKNAKGYLNDIGEIEGPKQDILDTDAVRRSFHEFNWTGAPPPPPPDPVEPGPAVAEVPYDPMADLITIQVIMEDQQKPERGRAWVKYEAASRVVVDPESSFLNEIRVGQMLPDPIGFATVKAITARDGITFSFADPDRPDETVKAEEPPSGITPHRVHAGEQPIRPSREKVPTIDRAEWRPKRTTKIDEDTWVIGVDDAQRFGDDFGGILAREVRHGRHTDKNGKYDGIELKDVKAGGMAERHGAKTGDIIKSINGHPVTSTAEAITYVKNHKDEHDRWEVVVENRGKERTVVYDSPSN
jgi:hypothetical protein